MKRKFERSFFHRFVIYFILLILFPILFSWWLYERVLNLYYAESTLRTQQIYLDNSVSVLDSSLDDISNLLVALNGNAEIINYLDYSPYKSNMFFGTFRDIASFCEELYQVTPYLTSLKIYSDSPLVIYAPPFERLDKLSFDEELQEKLDGIGLQEIVWSVEVSDTEGFPELYGYQKIYSSGYVRCIGYIEVQLSSDFFKEYFELLSEFSDDPHAVWRLYQKDQLIWSNAADEMLLALESLSGPGYTFSMFRNSYENCVELPRLDLRVVRSGSLSDRIIMPVNNVPSVFISVIIILLLGLFIGFFFNVALLSRRILDFSDFIRNADPDRLVPFQPKKESSGRADEIDTLVNAYNALIQENSSLISAVRKMELLSQEARYRALQSQIHPHFIYGTLETIRMTALMNRDHAAADMIFSLAALIRYSISISAKAVTLKEEFEIAEHYLKIQKVRIDVRIDYELQMEEDMTELTLPSFLIQPILENAFVYGISQTTEHCSLMVSAYRKGEDIVLTVSNTGRQITAKRLDEVNRLLAGEMPPEAFQGKNNGTALYNIRERLAIFFSGRASIRLETEECCTMTKIVIREEENDGKKKQEEKAGNAADTDC